MAVPAPDRPKLAEIAAAISAGIAVVASLAVSGVLQRAMRNHGSLLLVGLVIIIAASFGWFVPSFPRRHDRPAHGDGFVHRLAHEVDRFFHRLFSELYRWAPVLFTVGLIVAIVAVFFTQQDGQRPAVQADFDRNTGVLRATITASGVPTNGLVWVQVDNLKDGSDPKSDYQIVGKPIYYAGLGPDPDGQITYTVQMPVPAAQDALGVTAWRDGNAAPRCSENADLNESQQAGCLVLRLKP